MLQLNLPLWLIVVILGVEGWPYVLTACVILAIGAVVARGWLRGIAIVLLLPCTAVMATAAWWGIDARIQDRETTEFEAKIHEVLDHDRVVDGVPLPAGTAVQWTDVDRAQLRNASPAQPITLFGLRVSWLSRADDGSGWDVQLPEPQQIEGWTCETIGVRLSHAGQLLSCSLAAGRIWQGWPIPAGSLLELRQEGGKLGLVLPRGASMAAPEIGHALTSTGIFTLNADGSLDTFSFDDDDPLRVAGLQLSNTVEWSYNPATLGQGRRRRALTIRGSSIDRANGTSGTVTIRLSDGQILATD